MAKSKIAKKVTDTEKNIVTFNFTDGRKLVADIGYFDEEMIYRLACHGVAQKMGDSYAGAETVDEAYMAAKGVLDQLSAGIWATKASRGGIWVEALARVLQIPFEEALEKWEKLDEAKMKDTKKHPQMVLAKAQIEMERAQKSIPADETDTQPLDL